ncbi:hypothetical protein DEO72_LG5g675 [Vigna unguiculata]|uniref:Uncharacterized protein n=1 Tax=Vigna unguiculata TaxID=3917 RepID=A0A4D6LW82_VIGUN|nr:hypothetical protein DEO72_LG5g675 [Vigna unguiculata]
MKRLVERPALRLQLPGTLILQESPLQIAADRGATERGVTTTRSVRLLSLTAGRDCIARQREKHNHELCRLLPRRLEELHRENSHSHTSCDLERGSNTICADCEF